MKAEKRHKGGFTLVEIMVVTIIIGLLAAMATQTFISARKRSQATVAANDFRLYKDAFAVFALEEGYWPADVGPGVKPTGMEDSLPRFSDTSPVGGNWDWDENSVGFTASVSLFQPGVGDETMSRVDEILDDGDLAAGYFQKVGADRYTFILEE